jgi:oligopeptidase A
MRTAATSGLKLPDFSAIDPDQIESTLDDLMARNRAALAARLDEGGPFTWDNLVAPLEEQEDQLHRTWSPVNHLHAVADTGPLRAAYNVCLPKLTEYATEIEQNERLYDAYKVVAAGAATNRLAPAQIKVLDNALRDFRLGGVALPPPERDRFRAIQRELATLQSRFEENLLDATQGWTKHVTDPDPLHGVPESALALAAANARDRGLPGYVLTLDYPCYQPVMQYADNADLRREMYLAYVTRASDQGPNAGRWDNSAVMARIMTLRADQAGLLGFANYAEYSLARKMARTPTEVLGFLRDLAVRALPVARNEYTELCRFAREHDGIESLAAWDVAYYSERQRRHLFDFSEEELRAYFPLPGVLSGLFEILRRLYGITLREATGMSTWHPDVRCFEVHDEHGRLRGALYMDLYARQHKRGGAWMDDCVVRRRPPSGLQQPVAYLIFNFMPPVNGRPSLLTHDETMTLFHECGHALHHVLTLVDYADVSGIRGIPWDAVELPSQFMENWCWEHEALALITRHHETGAPLPAEMIRKVQAARRFQSGLHMVRQLELALFDFRLHHERRGQDGADIQRVLDEVRAEVAVIRPPPENRFQHSFGHIFAGGYAAGYYSYKWAEVLSADAFSRFEETGIFDPATGRQFMHAILEQGGARDPMELFVAFRGRQPSVEALLRHAGIPDYGPEPAVA